MNNSAVIESRRADGGSVSASDYPCKVCGTTPSLLYSYQSPIIGVGLVARNDSGEKILQDEVVYTGQSCVSAYLCWEHSKHVSLECLRPEPDREHGSCQAPFPTEYEHEKVSAGSANQLQAAAERIASALERIAAKLEKD